MNLIRFSELSTASYFYNTLVGSTLEHQRLRENRNCRKEALLDMSYKLVSCNGEVTKLKTDGDYSDPRSVCECELRTTKKREGKIQDSGVVQIEDVIK